MSVYEARRWATGLLAGASDTPHLDAEVLLSSVLGVTRTALHVGGERCLSRDQAERYTALVRRRLACEPIAYLTGRRAFYDVELRVDSRVLIPRPETELVIEVALEWAKGSQRGPLRVVDVGTGSGALAIVLARHLGQAGVIATEISAGALRVAAANVAAYGLRERITLLRGDLLAPVSGPVDLIVSNPPYVPQDRLPRLPDDVRLYEPIQALDGGPGGLELIERLLCQARERLGTPGLLVVEIDATQGDAVRDMSDSLWRLGRVSILPDYAGRDRVLRVELS